MTDPNDIYTPPKSNLSLSASSADNKLSPLHGDWSKGMTIVMTAPPLITFNGIGFRFYGKSFVDMEKTSYIAIYYFTFFYLPVMPLSRYLISLDSKRVDQVTASLPLRTIDKIHMLVVALIAGVGFAIFLK
ncbi:hypothetical protein ACO0LM_27605 [Undibacterium sp. Di26W]|uniref:hypothetical protein n=1 Tax=Undibacterium sp. Di26W TaxID=3413035 RepID=UPI003BF2DCE4